MPPKRKRSAVATAQSTADSPPLPPDRSQIRKTEVPLPPNVPRPARRQSSRGSKAERTDPNLNPDILDGAIALRASPDGHEDAPIDSIVKPPISNGTNKEDKIAPDKISDDKTLSTPAANGDTPVASATKNKRKKAGAPQIKAEDGDENTNILASDGVAENSAVPAADTGVPGDPENADGAEADEGDELEVKEALSRPPPVNSEYLPLPWKGRLGYVCILHAFFLTWANACASRLVSIRTFAAPILPSSVPEHAESRASLSIAIP